MAGVYQLIKKSPVYWVAGVISLILSVCSVMQEWVINPDAICYLQSASMLHKGLHAAMELCGQAKWPFYSMGIAALVNAFSVSYVHAAYLLNAIFSAITVVAFIGIVSLLLASLEMELKQKQKIVWLAALVILSAHELNAVRQYIIRDHGYWAFYLVSLWFLLHYVRQPSWYLAGAWSFALLVATLFRIEGCLFLIGAPFTVWFMKNFSIARRALAFLQLNALNLLLGASLVLWFYLHPGALHHYKRLEDLQFQLTHGVHLLAQRYYWQGNALIHYVLGHGTAQIGAYLLFVSLLAWYAMTLISSLSIVCFLLLLYAWYNREFKAVPSYRLVISAYVAVNILITLVFLNENMFLSKRYVMALTLTLLLWVPFALQRLILQWRERKWLVWSLLLFLILSSLGGVFNFGYSKKYIYEAGTWLSKNVPPQAKLYSNDFQVMYYSNHFNDQIFNASKEQIDPGIQSLLKDSHWQQYDYIALRFTKKEVENNFQLLSEIHWQPAQVFQNKRGDKVLIYSTKELKSIT